MKKFSKKPERLTPERLTAAQARAIPIEVSLVENILQEIYKGVRKVASHGGSEILWRNSEFSDAVKQVVKRRLEDDGYYVNDTKSYFVWKISWKELW